MGCVSSFSVSSFSVPVNDNTGSSENGLDARTIPKKSPGLDLTQHSVHELTQRNSYKLPLCLSLCFKFGTGTVTRRTTLLLWCFIRAALTSEVWL